MRIVGVMNTTSMRGAGIIMSTTSIMSTTNTTSMRNAGAGVTNTTSMRGAGAGIIMSTTGMRGVGAVTTMMVAAAVTTTITSRKRGRVCSLLWGRDCLVWEWQRGCFPGRWSV